MQKRIEYCSPKAVKIAPAGPEWLHEIKMDGYRDGDTVRLRSKSGLDWTWRYPLSRCSARRGRPASAAGSRRFRSSAVGRKLRPPGGGSAASGAKRDRAAAREGGGRVVRGRGGFDHARNSGWLSYRLSANSN